ncbi:MAG: hypothetical protein Q8R61_08880 [Thiobacillus sp.]|uniref:hypothetical protein n=1 Tax=Thiobacillus sp. TaxID=924 RepID=UPI002732E169|nr:hypothetical protein [Thiobacillus sp.]MDP3585226.1 hypothetical protein [Thiobacillus sp.]
MKHVGFEVNASFFRRVLGFVVDKAKLILAAGGVIVSLLLLAVLVGVVYWFSSYLAAGPESAKIMAEAEADNYSALQNRMKMYELNDSDNKGKSSAPQTHKMLDGTYRTPVHFNLTDPKLLFSDAQKKVYKFSFLENISGEHYLAVVRFHPIISEVCIISQSGAMVSYSGWKQPLPEKCLESTQ